MTTKTVLSNGLTIIADQKDIQTANIRVVVNAGALNETEEVSGISHFLEHMAFKGTVNKSAKELIEDIEFLGGDTGAYTTKDHTCYYVSLPDKNCKHGIKFLASILKESNFPENELEKEREVIIQEYKEANSDPIHLAWWGLQDTMFNGKASARQVLGTLDNIKKFTRDDLLNYFQTFYTAENMYISISSNWSEDLMIWWVKENFEDFRKGSKNVFLTDESNCNRHLRKSKEGIVQDYIFMALPWINYNDKDFYTSLIFKTILDGGMSCRLFQELRENSGLCYSCYTFDDICLSSSIFGIGTIVEPQNKDLVIDKVKQVVNSMKTDISENELTKAKNMAAYAFACYTEDIKNMAKKQIHNIRYKNELYDADKAYQAIQSITLNDVFAFANRMIDDSKWSSFTLEPKND